MDRDQAPPAQENSPAGVRSGVSSGSNRTRDVTHVHPPNPNQPLRTDRLTSVGATNPRTRTTQNAAPTIEEIAQERLEAFKLKVQKQERLERLWTTHGSSARSKCSVWAPIVTLGNFVQRNKV